MFPRPRIFALLLGIALVMFGFGCGEPVENDTANLGAALSHGEDGDDESGSHGAHCDRAEQMASESKPHKITICHIPPGNPDNAHTINISKKAVRAHLDHGDTLDGCGCADDGDDKDDDDGDDGADGNDGADGADGDDGKDDDDGDSDNPPISTTPGGDSDDGTSSNEPTPSGSGNPAGSGELCDADQALCGDNFECSNNQVCDLGCCVDVIL